MQNQHCNKQEIKRSLTRHAEQVIKENVIKVIKENVIKVIKENVIKVIKENIKLCPTYLVFGHDIIVFVNTSKHSFWNLTRNDTWGQ